MVTGTSLEEGGGRANFQTGKGIRIMRGKRPSHQWAGDVNSSGSAEALLTVRWNKHVLICSDNLTMDKGQTGGPTEGNLCLVVVENLGQIWDKLM